MTWDQAFLSSLARVVEAYERSSMLGHVLTWVVLASSCLFVLAIALTGVEIARRFLAGDRPLLGPWE